MRCQTGEGKGFVGPLTKVVGGSEASDLHVLLVVRPALQNRGYSLETEKKRRVGGKTKRKNRMRGRAIKGGWEGRGVGEEGRDGGKRRGGRERKKEELFSEGLKIVRRIKEPRRNSFAS